LAIEATQHAVAEIRDRVEQSRLIPADLSLHRVLEVDEVQAEGRVQEYVLCLSDLSGFQAGLLADRGWTVVRTSAKISLPPDAYERERDWLTAQEII
jgi:hypothetical protein